MNEEQQVVMDEEKTNATVQEQEEILSTPTPDTGEDDVSFADLMDDLKEHIGKNLGGIILTLVMTVIIIISTFQNNSLSGGQIFGYILLGSIADILLGYLGYKLGKGIRDIIKPDFVIASGFMDLLKENIFWAIGPQTIGCFAGAILGNVLITMLLSIGG